MTLLPPWACSHLGQSRFALCPGVPRQAPANAGDTGSIPGSGRYPREKETATHSSLLAWEIPWTEEPGRLQVHGGGKESDTTESLSRLTLRNQVKPRTPQTTILLSREARVQFRMFELTLGSGIGLGSLYRRYDAKKGCLHSPTATTWQGGDSARPLLNAATLPGSGGERVATGCWVPQCASPRGHRAGSTWSGADAGGAWFRSGFRHWGPQGQLGQRNQAARRRHWGASPYAGAEPRGQV